MVLSFVAIGIAIMGLFLPTASFTKVIANGLFCAIANPNCLNNYCGTPVNSFTLSNDNCNQNFSGGFGGNCPDNLMLSLVPGLYQCATTFSTEASTTSENSTKRVFNTICCSSFTTYTKALAVNSQPTQFGTNDFVYCIASAQIKASNVSTIINFRISDIFFNQNAPSWSINAPVANSNFTISYMIAPPLPVMVGNNRSIYALQFSVTVTGFITVYHATIICTDYEVFSGATIG